MALDPGIFDAVGRFPSVEDWEAKRSQVAINRLHSLLLDNEVGQLPLRNRLLALQADTSEIGNDKARQLLGFMRRMATHGQIAIDGGAAVPAPVMPASQWSPGGAQDGSNGGALPAGAPPVALPVSDTPQPPPQGRQGPMPAPVGARPQVPNIGGMNADQLSIMHALGGPDMMPTLKMLTEGVAHAPGSQVIDMRTGEVRTVPTLDKGQVLEGGRVNNIPGFVDATAAAAGATAAAQEGAKANLTPLPPSFVGADGRPVGGSVGRYVGAPQPGASPPQGGAPFAPPSSLDQVPAQRYTTPDGRPGATQQDIVADSLARGQDPSTLKVNGASVHAEEQQQLDAAKQGGPQAMARFAQTWLPRLQQIPDPAQRQRAIQGFMADLATPPGTPVHSMGPAPGSQPQPANPGRTELAGPAELAGHETGARKVEERFHSYKEGLDKRVDEGFTMQRRNAEIMANLEQFQTGLVGGHVRAELASSLANAFPENGTIQELAGRIVGGGPDAPAAAQTFNSLVAGAMISNAIQTLNGQGRLNQGEVAAFKAASESAQTDPRALARIIEIQNRFAEQDLAEQQALAAAQRNGTFDPRTWTADWAKLRRSMMSDPSSPFAPASAQPMPGSRDPANAPAASAGAPTRSRQFTYIGTVKPGTGKP